MIQTSEFELGKEMFAYIRKRKKQVGLFSLAWLKDQMLKITMTEPNLQSQIFRFVDVLPSLKNEKQIAHFLEQYLGSVNHPIAQASGIANKLPFLQGLTKFAVNVSVKQLASTFICGSTREQAQKKIDELESSSKAYTLDILGELALSLDEANEYFNQYLALIREIPHVNISVKLSALYPNINPIDFNYRKEVLKERLREIYREAVVRDAFINVDTEHYYDKDLCFEITRELLMEPEFKSWTGAGIVLQAYLKDSERDLQKWIAWARQRNAPIMLRLVKGAYWDYEYALSKQKNWPCPVFTNKHDSDINYEKLSGILLEHVNYIRPAFASHNIRSLAKVLSLAKDLNIEKSAFEIQMLYGMLDDLKDYFSEQGYVLRVYLPYGDLIPGMSYLVRRLLENTANDSFLRQGFLDDKSEDELLQDPSGLKNDSLEFNARPDLSGFSNLPYIDFSKKFNRDFLARRIYELEHNLNGEKRFPAIIDGGKVFNDNCFESINPAKPENILGMVSQSSIEDCDIALSAAQEVFAEWSKTRPAYRAKLLRLIAEKLEKQRHTFTGLLVLEAGKPWLDADAEVCEAIDFLRYYADQAMRINSEEKLRSFPGEKNLNFYLPFGVSVIISPWNFSLAIMAGMACASLVSGNSVIVKPSEQTSIICHEFTKLVNDVMKSYCPKYIRGLFSFLPGDGEIIGDYLCKHEKVSLIAFTGSEEVGMQIHENAAKARPPKKVIAEMGGKNAVIVDLSADLDEAVPGVLYSAFSYAGQKCSACSRVFIEEEIYDQFCERIKKAALQIKLANPREEDCFVPPVIDMNALYKIKAFIEQGKKEGKVLFANLPCPENGFFVSPVIFTDLNQNSKVLNEEIFGPVLALVKVKNIDEAIAQANSTRFGLTGGIFSRSPENIEKASMEMQVGNFYINQRITGAVVSRQAFGGLKNSSIGFKAGGPNYLLQFMQEKVITENTMRRGFVSE